MRFDILTLFPESISGYLSHSILKRAQEKNKLSVNLVNFRDHATDKHHTVDDTPYGGGPGMVLKVEPIVRALEKLPRKKKSRVVMLTPQGKTFNHKDAVRLSKYDQVVFLCGRYEGFDKRIESFVDEKISIGDYVLSGGELPALVILEAVARQIPGVLGNEETLNDESFSKNEDYLEAPVYTRPETFEYQGKKMRVPQVLLSGDHAKIAEWRAAKSRKKPK